jgi:putative transposase
MNGSQAIGDPNSRSYHAVWSPKQRARVLTGPVARDLLALLRSKANQLGIVVEAAEVMPDHIHILISGIHGLTVNDAVRQLKGHTSFALRKHHEAPREGKTALWAGSSHIGEVDPGRKHIVENYIATQTER